MSIFTNNKISRLVTIIIPIYNAEKYLSRCLDSVLNQTLNNIEIICINDGSTDNSLKILEEYTLKDSRIIIINQDNKKQGAARNRGLDIAQGEYIAFVDSDDWIDNDYLELLYNSAKKYGVNIAASSTTRDYQHKSKVHLQLDEEKCFYGSNDIIKGLKNNLITHSKLYKFKPIKNLRFEEEVLYEDAPYTIKAIQLCNSMITVPSAHYHYFSNPTSTMKQKYGIKKENDKISTNLQVVDFAEQNNIELKDWVILKEHHLLWSVKHYKYKKDYYICGIKTFSKNILFDNSKNFIIFNTAYFGDVLLCNSLIQNIKNIFPESKVIFVCEKSWSDVAKYQEGIDEVVAYDKKGKHKGFFGMLKFICNFPYKKPFASFITYKNNRNFMIAKLLKSRFIISETQDTINLSRQERHARLLQQLTHKHVTNLPIKFNVPQNVDNKIENDKQYIVLCTTSKKTTKDMPIETAIALINIISTKTDYKIVLTGVGKKAINYAKNLTDNNCSFIDLTNKTNLLELAQVLKNANCAISVDTGTLHLSYALSTPTVAVFYEQDKLVWWAPNEDLYNSVVISEKQNAKNIYNNMINLLNEKHKETAIV